MVARAIIDQHNLEGLARGLHYRLQAVVEIGDILLLIVQRNDDRVFGHRSFYYSREAVPVRQVPNSQQSTQW